MRLVFKEKIKKEKCSADIAERIMVRFMIIRYFFAIIWTCLLVSFSYEELILNCFLDNNIGFDEKLTKLFSSQFMIFANTGLIAMLHIDNYITKKITKNNTQRSYTGLVILSFVMIIFLTWCAEIKEKWYEWFHLYYLFVIFLGCLIVYKAETLNIKRNSLEINGYKN